MKFIHPRRIFRQLKERINIHSFISACQTNHIIVSIGTNSRVKNCKVFSISEGEIVIGENTLLENCSVKFEEFNGESGGGIVRIGSNCVIKNTSFFFSGNACRIEIGDNVVFNALPQARNSLRVRGNTSIAVGDGCLLSDSIEINTTDYHFIFDQSGQIVNPNKSIRIGKHVWIGRGSTICKGVEIGDESVVGTRSVVTKSFSESNVIIAGCPAIIRKHGIIWSK